MPKNVLFIDIENDGYKLNSQHNFPIDEDDLPLAKKIILDRDKYYKIYSATVFYFHLFGF